MVLKQLVSWAEDTCVPQIMFEDDSVRLDCTYLSRLIHARTCEHAYFLQAELDCNEMVIFLVNERGDHDILFYLFKLNAVYESMTKIFLSDIFI